MRTLSILILLGISLFGLSLDEAVDKAIQNSYEIKRLEAQANELQSGIDILQSADMPSIDLSYFADIKDRYSGSQTKKSSQFSASLSYNLYDGEQNKYLKLANLSLLESKKIELLDLKKDLALRTKSAYIDLLQAKQNLQSAQENLKRYELHHKNAKSYFDQGIKVALNDLLQSEVQMLTAQQGLLQAQSAVVIATKSLENMIKEPLKDELKALYLEDTSNNYTLDTKQIKRKNVILVLEKKIEALQNQITATKSTDLPRVDLSLSHKRYSDEMLLFQNDNALSHQNIASATVSWNLYNDSLVDKKTIQIKHQIADINYAIAELVDSIALSFDSAHEAYQLSQKNYQVASKSLTSATTNLDVVSQRFYQGLSTSSDVLDANALLASAEARKTNAYYDVLVAQFQLERLLEK